jgi:CelD/BcsL family acetyltransferase involved in cellulose biosynthesis
MEYHVVPFDRLSSQELTVWSQLQESVPDYASPYYRPEFAQAVHAVRGDVEVAVLEEGGHPRGFFAFQRRGRTGYPVGSPMADFQGPVIEPGVSWSATGLLRASNLAAWNFDHLPASIGEFAKHGWRASMSPYLDLSAGFEAYAAERRQAGTDKIRKTMGLGRKMAAEVGTLRLVPHTAEPEVFARLLEWKRDQYRATGVPDALAAPWKRDLLERLVAVRLEKFAGMLSAMYAGDVLVAVHLGIRTEHVLHAWFPAYNPAYCKYSPGSILWVELARSAAEMGIRRIDLGKGSESYKQQFMSGATPLTEGRVDVRRVSRWLRQGWQKVRERIRSSALRRPAEVVMRMISPWLVRVEP